jgi:hypothetical protein
MFFNSPKFLKLFYSALLTGMPSLTYNPFNKNTLHAPFVVNQYSTYINYKLDESQKEYINNFLDKNTDGFELLPSSLLNDDSEEYFLSINIYNCSSPLFDFISDIIPSRCEINVYVKDKNDIQGTLIMEYASNILSLDPDNLFKSKSQLKFDTDHELVYGIVKDSNFELKFNYNRFLDTTINNKISSNLIKFTDKIFYKNGLYDKVYYDSSLIHNKIINVDDYEVYFKFFDMEFNKVDNIFYFEEKIHFVGGMWYNLNTNF